MAGTVLTAEEPPACVSATPTSSFTTVLESKDSSCQSTCIWLAVKLTRFVSNPTMLVAGSTLTNIIMPGDVRFIATPLWIVGGSDRSDLLHLPPEPEGE